MYSGDLMICGVSFHRTQLEAREKVSVPENRMDDAFSFLTRQPAVRESMILSTCNRSELYLSVDDWIDGKELFCLFAQAVCGIDLTQESNQIYVFRGIDAVVHSFRVASGLDSLILGEPQILGQMKTAYQGAESHNCVGRDLHRWIPEAFAAAKRVRNETGICEAAVSDSYAAVQLAKKIFDNLAGKSVLLLGAGKMAELAAIHMREAGASSLVVINRTVQHAEAVAALCSGSVLEFDRRIEEIAKADIVICSTNAPSSIIERDDVRRVFSSRPGRPLLILDLSVPRNIDPSLGELDGIYLFNVDDLQLIVEGNRQTRQAEAIRAEGILKRELEKFLRKERTAFLAPEIASLKKQILAVCQTASESLLHSMPQLTQEERNEVEQTLHRTAQKIVHIAVMELKTAETNEQTRLGKSPPKFSLETAIPSWHEAKIR